MKQSVLWAALAVTLAVGLAPRAEAITFTYSEKTQRVAPYFEFKGEYDLPFNLNLSGHLGFAPDLSSFVTPIAQTSGTSNSDLASQIANLIRWDTMLDLNLNVGYNFRVLDVPLGIGNVTTSLIPYVGYRHMWTFTGNLNNSSTNTQTAGLNYGLRLGVGLPLGFSAYAFGGASSLLGGSFEQGGTSQALNPNGMVLPRYGVGAAWNMPFLNMASVYAGYTGFFLPQDLRLSPTYTNGSALVHGLSAGFNILFFGI